MRVAFVVYGDLSPRSGGYRYDHELAVHLRSRGDEVDVVSLPDRPREEYLRRLGDNFRPALVRRLRRLAGEVDVFLQDELCHPSLGILNRRLDPSVPVVALVHHLRSAEPRPWWERRVARAFERAYLRSVDGYVYSSDATREGVAALVDPEPGIVGRPAGDRFAPSITPGRVRQRAHDGPLRVISVGSITPRKGIHTLLEGLARIRDPWQLTVVGDATAAPDYVDRLTSQCDDLGIQDRVAFTGRIGDDALADWFARSHLLAVPSQYEGFGIVYVEGMGFGLPALASTAGGASEIVDHDHNGLLVPPGSPGSIAEAVAPLCRDRDRLARLGIGALDSYRAHPGWTETCERIRSFLRTVVEES